MSRFVFLQDGGVVAMAAVRISDRPLTIVQTVTPVTIREGQVCGDLQDTRISQLMIDGKPARPEEANEVRDAMQEAWREDFGKPSCSRYTAEGDLLTVETTVDGVLRPDSRRRMMWVDPDSGFGVGS
jgi:hypothetical protein